MNSPQPNKFRAKFPSPLYEKSAHLKAAGLHARPHALSQNAYLTAPTPNTQPWRRKPPNETGGRSLEKKYTFVLPRQVSGEKLWFVKRNAAGVESHSLRAARRPPTLMVSDI